MKTYAQIKKRLLVSFFISFPVLCFFLFASYQAGQENSVDGAAFLVMMAILGSFTGLICLFAWIGMFVNPNNRFYIIPIFISVHTALWGTAWFLAMILFPDIEDKVPLFFLFPMIVGLLSFGKVFNNMNSLKTPNEEEKPWPPTSIKRD